MSTRKNNSIKRQLLLWLLVPLVCLFLFNMLVCYPLALHLSEDAFDRQLLNSADSVAARVKVFPGNKITVDLPPAAQAILRYDNKDKFYYQVVSGAGRNVSGDAIPLPSLKAVSPSLRYDYIAGRKVRVATLGIVSEDSNDQGLVQVAETLASRAELTEQLLMAILGPQLLLLFLVALSIRFGIDRGLRPLVLLQQQIASRSQFDLSPVPTGAAPVEVGPLVESINMLLKQLQKDIETQRRFVANAAHQLRTPLAGAKTYMDLARRNSDDPKVNGMIAQADVGISRMTRLVTKLLSLAKAEPESASKPHQLQMDLNDLAATAASQLVPEAVSKSIELAVEPSDMRTFVNGDRDALQEMIANLIENAIRYTPDAGSVKVRVIRGPQPKLEVVDTGPGIPEAEREKIFERFYRIADTEADGSGLGLAIVKEIAMTHNIAVDVSPNENDHGTIFSLTFQ